MHGAWSTLVREIGNETMASLSRGSAIYETLFCYSVRRACMGSMPAARRAGM
jgi:hypothetical protein